MIGFAKEVTFKEGFKHDETNFTLRYFYRASTKVNEFRGNLGGGEVQADRVLCRFYSQLEKEAYGKNNYSRESGTGKETREQEKRPGGAQTVPGAEVVEKGNSKQ